MLNFDESNYIRTCICVCVCVCERERTKAFEKAFGKDCEIQMSSE